jgi:hypothetical protein
MFRTKIGIYLSQLYMKYMYIPFDVGNRISAVYLATDVNGL